MSQGRHIGEMGFPIANRHYKLAACEPRSINSAVSYIPGKIREEFGLQAGLELDIERDGREIKLHLVETERLRRND